MLSDRRLRRLAAEGLVEPFDPEMIQPASIDLRLDRHFLIMEKPRGGAIDPESGSARWTPVSGNGIQINPGDFILGSTYEFITMPNHLSAQFEGKSSLGRLGLLTHITAGFIDPGFEGHITLEFSNVTRWPIRLYAGMKIGQMCVTNMSGEVERPYGSQGVGSHYQGQRGPTASRSHENFHRTIIEP